MKMTLIFLSIFSLLPMTAKSAGEESIKKKDLFLLNRLAAKKLKKDFRIVFTFKKDAKICGGEGDAYFGQVQVNKYSREYGPNGEHVIKDRWMDIEKIYTIFTADMAGPKAALFDPDNCME